MALAVLYEKGFVKYVVSTNVDGLHRRSGLPREGLAELHGNCYKEFCNICNHEYLRAFDCTSEGCRRDHLTGRKCEQTNCPGHLVDSIIHFGENLPASEINPAIEQSEKADLALVLGTSMKVSPACNLPKMCFKNHGKLVICNLQKTPFDMVSTIKMHVPTDIVMHLLLAELGLLDEIPKLTPEGYPIEHPAPYNARELQEKSNTQMQKIATPSNGSGSRANGPVNGTVDDNPNNGGYVSALVGRLSGINLRPGARPASFVEGKNGEKTEIASAQRSDLLFVRACTDCEFAISKLTTKLIVESVNSTTISVNESILTGTCEIISCQNATIIFNVMVPTITVDKSTNCTIAFDEAAYGIRKPQIFWSQCTDLKLKVGAQEHLIPTAATLRPQADPETAQFRSTWNNSSVQTEFIIREGAGYATTEREKAENDAREARDMAIYNRLLAGGGGAAARR